MLLTSLAAGVIGSIVGIGGGLLVTPVLTLIFGVDIHLAIGASIVAIIATSSGGAVAYIRDRITNIRVGMYLEIGTTLGAITGAALAAYANSALLFGVFGAVLLASVIPLFRKRKEEIPKAVVNDSITGLAEQVARIKNETVSEKEMNNVKQKIRGFFFLDHQKTADQANYLGLYEMQGEGYHYDVEFPDRLDRVTSTDVKEVANKYLVNPTTAIVGPFEPGNIQ